MDQFPQSINTNPTSLGIVGAERPRVSLFWVWVGLLLVLLGGGGTALYLYHFDSLVDYAPQSCAVYAHVNSRFWSSLPEKYNQLLQDKSAAWGLSPAQMETVINAKVPLAVCYQEDGSAIFMAKNNKKFSAQLATAGIQAQTSSDTDVLYFPTTSTGYWLSEPAQRLNYKRTLWDFSTIHTYIFTTKVAAIPHELREFVPDMQTWGYGSFTKGAFTWKSAVIQSKAAKTPSLLKNIPPNTTLFAQNVNLHELSLPATSIAENVTFKLLHDFPGNLSVATGKDGSFVAMIPASTANSEIVSLVLSAAIARILPSEKEKELPDGTTAVNYVADPMDWPFVEEQLIGTLTDPANWPFVENQKILTLSVPELNLKLEVIPTEQGTLILNNLKREDMGTWEMEEQGLIAKCGKNLYSWVYIPAKTISLQNYMKEMIIGLSTDGKMQICIN